MRDNLLLAALPQAERERLQPFLTMLDLPLESRMVEPDTPIKHVYFPIDLVGSNLQLMSDGSAIESGLMGSEGMVGVPVWLRQRQTSQLIFVQVPGRTWRMDTEVFLREVVHKTSPLNDLMADYTHAYLVLTGLIAACNRLHDVDERMCRWLRMVQNRIPDRPEFPMRQEYLAQMLGVQRPSVSIAAGMLQKAGWISYTRGIMRIVDPEGLSSGACECYETMEAQFKNMYPNTWPPEVESVRVPGAAQG